MMISTVYSYVINLVELMLIKVEGQSLVDHPVVLRLTEIRTVRNVTQCYVETYIICCPGDREDTTNRPQAALPGGQAY